MAYPTDAPVRKLILDDVVTTLALDSHYRREEAIRMTGPNRKRHCGGKRHEGNELDNARKRTPVDPPGVQSGEEKMRSEERQDNPA